MCLTSGIFTVLVNGSEGRKFQCKRSLMQGVPHSPFLFVFVTNVFTKMINIGKAQNAIQDLEKFENGIISLHYDDDTIIFSVPNVVKLRNLKLLLYMFENVTGLNINFLKTETIWLDGLDVRQGVIASLIVGLLVFLLCIWGSLSR